MLALYIVLPTVFVLLLAYLLEIRHWERNHRHERCLRNIARLERELGMAEPEFSTLDFLSGRVWQVEQHQAEHAKLQCLRYRQLVEQAMYDKAWQ